MTDVEILAELGKIEQNIKKLHQKLDYLMELYIKMQKDYKNLIKS